MLAGGAGRDYLSGATGDDMLKSGADDDFFELSTGADTVRGGGGSDTISLESLMGLLPAVVNLASGTARIEAETTVSLSGIEHVVGSGYADILAGDGLADMLDGGTGADVLTGGAGADTLKGGAGADSFVFADVSWSRAASGIDDILGFAKAEDIIDLSLIDASPGGDDSAFVFIGTVAFSGPGPQVRIVVDGVAQTTTVQVRLDGSVADDMTILLDNDLVLTAANFVL